jgi:hypothetical protein
MRAFSDAQWLLLIATPTNQSYTFERFFVSRANQRFNAP